MTDRHRRRRSDDDYGRGGLPLFPLIIVVILAGLLLGGGLAHFFGGGKTPSTLPTAIAALPSPVVTATPFAAPTISATPVRTTAPTASPTTSPTPLASKSPKPTASPKKPARIVASVTATPSPIARATAAPPAHKPVVSATATPAVVTEDDNASSLVRSYLGALAHGDRTTAATYLSHGLPSETFMNGSARIQSIRASSVGAQRYQVTADILTAGDEYYGTFIVEQGPSGLQIADHYWIKTQ